MKYMGNDRLSRVLLSFLAIGIILFGVLSIVTMNHEMAVASQGSAISQSDNCSDAHDAGVCVSYHLDIMQNLSAGTHSDLGLQLISLFLFLFVGFLTLGLFKILEHSYSLKRIRFRQLYEKTVTAFARQLGYWLILFEKRDPACALYIGVKDL